MLSLMLAILLTWSQGDIIEMALSFVLIALVMAITAAIPFIAERYIDDRREEPSEEV